MPPGFLFIDFALSICAAISAFLIVYEEYTHHYTDRRMPFKHAFQTSILTFIVFFTLGAIALFVLGNKVF